MKVEETCKISNVNQSILLDANNRLIELETQIEETNVEFGAYKEKAKKVLQVNEKNCYEDVIGYNI